MRSKKITLKSGYEIIVDADDYDRVMQHSWHIIQKKGSRKLNVVTNLKTKSGTKKVTLGKFIMKPPKGKMVYPRRSNLDFRKANLVICTMAERQQMLPKRKTADSSSQYKGVCYDADRGKWRAHITIDGVTGNIGFFDSEEKAARAYNKRAKLLFGSLAYQNQFGKKFKRRKSD